jgi:hypothetical protein
MRMFRCWRIRHEALPCRQSYGRGRRNGNEKAGIEQFFCVAPPAAALRPSAERNGLFSTRYPALALGSQTRPRAVAGLFSAVPLRGTGAWRNRSSPLSKKSSVLIPPFAAIRIIVANCEVAGRKGWGTHILKFLRASVSSWCADQQRQECLHLPREGPACATKPLKFFGAGGVPAVHDQSGNAQAGVPVP